jgi:hypothetical protein
MIARRPRVALDISTRLFRDALTRALAPHVDVSIAPESAAEQAAWVQGAEQFDLLIVSGRPLAGDVPADRVIELPSAEGGQPDGSLGGPGSSVRTLDDLLDLIPAGAP